MSELFKKNGELRKISPKRYACKECGHISNRTRTYTMGGIGFARCWECGDTVKTRPVYEEWMRRNSGQWDDEERILNLFKGDEWISKEEVESIVPDNNHYGSNSALGYLVWNNYLDVDDELRDKTGEIRYQRDFRKEHSSV